MRLVTGFEDGGGGREVALGFATESGPERPFDGIFLGFGGGQEGFGGRGELVQLVASEPEIQLGQGQRGTFGEFRDQAGECGLGLGEAAIVVVADAEVEPGFGGAGTRLVAGQGFVETNRLGGFPLEFIGAGEAKPAILGHYPFGVQLE